MFSVIIAFLVLLVTGLYISLAKRLSAHAAARCYLYTSIGLQAVSIVVGVIGLVINLQSSNLECPAPGVVTFALLVGIAETLSIVVLGASFIRLSKDGHPTRRKLGIPYVVIALMSVTLGLFELFAATFCIG